MAALLASGAGPAQAQLQHAVQAGDTLWGLSAQYTGKATDWPALQRANRLSDPNHLRVGQVLRIPAAAGRLPAADASVTFVLGEVWATPPGGQPPSLLRVGVSVPEGTQIEVRDKGFVRLKLADGSAFGLSAGTTAKLETLRRDHQSQQSQTLIHLLSGRVESEVVPRQHPRSRFDVHTPMAVASVRGTRFGVSADPDASTSDVAQGRVAVRSLLNRRQSTTIAAGEGARVGPVGGLQHGPLLPAADLSGLPSQWDDGEFVPFALPDQPHTQAYRVRVLQADTPGAVVRESWVKEPRVVWQALDDGSYTLTVQGLDHLGLLGQTAEHPFRVLATPAAPLYRHPAAGASVSGAALTLRCTELLNVDSYRIQVASDAGFSQPVVDAIHAARCEHVAQLPPGRYHWRVASRSAGAQGPYSLPSTFEVVATSSTGSAPDAGTAFWSPRPGMTYRVQLAEDADFTRVLRDDWLSGNQVVLPATGTEAVYLRWQSRDPEGRTSRLSPVHRLALDPAGLRTGDNAPVQAGDQAVGTGNETLQRPR